VNTESTQRQKEKEEKSEKKVTDTTFKRRRGQIFFGFQVSLAVPIFLLVTALLR
jgi:hypothetical protein